MRARAHGIGIALMAAVLLAGCGQATVDTTERDASGEVTQGGDVGVLKLRVGDCLDLSGMAEPGEDTVVESFTAIPCADPHQGEVFLVEEDFFAATPEFPGQDEVFEQAGNRCVGPFGVFVGAPYDETELDFVTLAPTADSWAQDDRGIVCIAVSPTADGAELETITGSLEGTG